MTVTQRRKTWSTRTTKKFAQGKHARAICDRTGFEHPMSEMVVEPGTNLLVHNSVSDGAFNLVDHPQNYPPRELGDAIGLKNPRVDREFENFVYLSDTLDILQLSDSGDNVEFSE